MDVFVVIVDQLDFGGELKSFRMQAEHGHRVTVALASDYSEPRNGPFHFLDCNHQRKFKEGFAQCVARKLPKSRYGETEAGYYFNTSWSGIPTEKGRLSYYALSLPEFCVPTQIKIFNPMNEHEYNKAVNRDDQNNRYIIYLECRSSFGSFDFDLNVIFKYEKNEFIHTNYHDDTTTDRGRPANLYQRHCLDGDQSKIVQQFMMENVYMGDRYEIGQAGAVGRYAKAENNTFQQIWSESSSNINLPQLARDLESLRGALKTEGTTIEHDKALASVAQAEESAQQGDGAGALHYLKAAGQWALDVATKIGTNVAAAAIAKAMEG